MTSKVDKLYVDKLVPVPVVLSKLSDGLKNDIFKKMYMMLRYLATNTTLNAKINEIKNNIPSFTHLATITAITTAKNEIPNVSDLFKKAGYVAKNISKRKKFYF